MSRAAVPLHAVTAVRERFALIYLAVFRLQHCGAGSVFTQRVREDEVIVAVAAATAGGFRFQVEVFDIWLNALPVVVAGDHFQHVVAFADVAQRHSQRLAGVFQRRFQVAFFRLAVVVNARFNRQFAFDLGIEGQLSFAVLDFGAGQVADADLFGDSRRFFLIGNHHALHRAALLGVDRVVAEYRIDVAFAVFHPGTHRFLFGVDLAGQRVTPAVFVGQRLTVDRQFGFHRQHFTVRIEEAGDHLVANLQVFTGEGTLQLLAPFRHDAVVFEVNVNHLIETVYRVIDFPHAVNHLIAGSLRHHALVHFAIFWRLGMAINLAERLFFEGLARQRLVHIPVLFGDVVTPVIGFVLGGVVPGERLWPRLHGIQRPDVDALAIQRLEAVHPAAGQLAVERRRAAREAGNLLDALRFPLRPAAVGVAAQLALVGAALGHFDITVRPGGRGGRERCHHQGDFG